MSSILRTKNIQTISTVTRTRVLPTLIQTRLNHQKQDNSDSIMPQGTDKSHATGGSIVPEKLQEVLPQKVEEKVPNSIHDTGSSAGATDNAGKSHATGDSVVPKPAQEAVPKGLEKALPEGVHPTE